MAGDAVNKNAGGVLARQGIGVEEEGGEMAQLKKVELGEKMVKAARDHRRGEAEWKEELMRMRKMMR